MPNTLPHSAHPVLLLIEDNPDDAALARRALKKFVTPVEMKVAESVTSALEILLHSSAPLPTAVFVDLNMPEKNGFDFLRIVRSNKQTATLPVVVLTTSNRSEDVEMSYQLGANGYVTKPLDFSEFAEVFNTMSQYWLRVNQSPHFR